MAHKKSRSTFKILAMAAMAFGLAGLNTGCAPLQGIGSLLGGANPAATAANGATTGGILPAAAQTSSASAAAAAAAAAKAKAKAKADPAAAATGTPVPLPIRRPTQCQSSACADGEIARNTGTVELAPEDGAVTNADQTPAASPSVFSRIGSFLGL